MSSASQNCEDRKMSAARSAAVAGDGLTKVSDPLSPTVSAPSVAVAVGWTVPMAR